MGCHFTCSSSKWWIEATSPILHTIVNYFCHVALTISVHSLRLLSRERHCKSKVSCPKHNWSPGKSSNPPLVHCPNIIIVISKFSLQFELLFLQNNNHVDDLFTDLCDGRLLICLLETISGEKLGKIGMDHYAIK